MANPAIDTRAEQAAIDELYDRWRQAWLKVDGDLMVSLFDKHFDGLVYQAEEVPNGILTYEGIVDYWKNAVNILAQIKEWRETRPKRVIFLAPGVAVIWTEVMTNIKATMIPEDICGVLRCTIGVRKKDDGKWAIVHYHESRQLIMNQEPSGKWTLLPDAVLR